MEFAKNLTNKLDTDKTETDDHVIPSTWFDSLTITLKTEPPAHPDGTPIHPQVAFIQDVDPKDRRICLAAHDFHCRKTKFDHGVFDKGIVIESNKDSTRRSTVTKKIRTDPKLSESNVMKDFIPKNSFPQRFRAVVAADSSFAGRLRATVAVGSSANSCSDETMTTTTTSEITATKNEEVSNQQQSIEETKDILDNRDGDDNESIGEILTSLVASTEPSWLSTSSITRPGDGFAHSVYYKFIQHYESCYNQHDSNLLSQLYRNSCFSRDVIREIYYWRPPYTLLDEHGAIVAKQPPFLTYRHVIFGVDNICQHITKVYNKIPDSIVVYTKTNIQYYPEREITIVKTSLTYFYTIVKQIPSLSDDNQPITTMKLINIELLGQTIYIFNSEGRIIQIYDTVVTSKCSEPSYAPRHVFKLLGY